MSLLLTPAEIATFKNLPESDLAELAADLDILVPEVVQREELLGRIIVAIADYARHNGLPLSEYDRADLEALPPDHLAALARLCGVKPSVDALLKAGARVYKGLRKRGTRSQVPLILPMLLTILARYAADADGLPTNP